MSGEGAFQLEFGSALAENVGEELVSVSCSSGVKSPDGFLHRDGVDFAGTHLVIDLFGAQRLDNIGHVERALTDCVEAAGATLLHIHLHHFQPNGGVSGVAVLAESHISIHSWPERGYAALDIFMCGNARPERCIHILKSAFSPQRIKVTELLRGEGA